MSSWTANHSDGGLIHHKILDWVVRSEKKYGKEKFYSQRKGFGCTYSYLLNDNSTWKDNYEAACHHALLSARDNKTFNTKIKGIIQYHNTEGPGCGQFVEWMLSKEESPYRLLFNNLEFTNIDDIAHEFFVTKDTSHALLHNFLVFSRATVEAPDTVRMWYTLVKEFGLTKEWAYLLCRGIVQRSNQQYAHSMLNHANDGLHWPVRESHPNFNVEKFLKGKPRTEPFRGENTCVWCDIATGNYIISNKNTITIPKSWFKEESNSKFTKLKNVTTDLKSILDRYEKEKGMNIYA